MSTLPEHRRTTITYITDLTERLRTLADRLDAEGPDAVQRARDWNPGPRPAPRPGRDISRCTNCIDLEEPCTNCLELATILPDHVIAERLADQRTATIATQIITTINQLDTATINLTRLLTLLTATRPTNPHTDDNPRDGECRSCWRIREVTPIATHPDGRARWADLCRWCGTWTQAHGEHPPIALLRWRQRNPGRRVTTALLERLKIDHHPSAH